MAKAIETAQGKAHLRACIEDMALRGQFDMAIEFCCDAAMAKVEYDTMARVAGALMAIQENKAGLEALDAAWNPQVPVKIMPPANPDNKSVAMLKTFMDW